MTGEPSGPSALAFTPRLLVGPRRAERACGRGRPAGPEHADHDDVHLAARTLRREGTGASRSMIWPRRHRSCMLAPQAAPARQRAGLQGPLFGSVPAGIATPGAAAPVALRRHRPRPQAQPCPRPGRAERALGARARARRRSATSCPTSPAASAPCARRSAWRPSASPASPGIDEPRGRAVQRVRLAPVRSRGARPQGPPEGRARRRERVDAARWTYQDTRELVVLVTGNLYLRTLAEQSRIEDARAELDTARALHELAVRPQVGRRSCPASTCCAPRSSCARASSVSSRRRRAWRGRSSTWRAPSASPSARRSSSPTPCPLPWCRRSPSSRRWRWPSPSRSDWKAAQAPRGARRRPRVAPRVGEALPGLSLDADYGAIGQTYRRRAQHVHARSAAVRVPLFQGGRGRGQGDWTRTPRCARRAGRASRTCAAASTTTSAWPSSPSRRPPTATRWPSARAGSAREQLRQAQDRFAAGVANNLDVVLAQETAARRGGGPDLVASTTSTWPAPRSDAPWAWPRKASGSSCEDNDGQRRRHHGDEDRDRPPASGGGPASLIGVAAVVLIGGGFAFWRYSAARVATDDAQIDGHIMPLAARVTGTVQRRARPGQPVRLGGHRPRRGRSRPTTSVGPRPRGGGAGRGHRRRAGRAHERAHDLHHHHAARRRRRRATWPPPAARIRMAQARVKETEAKATMAAQDLERMKTLVAKDEVSRQEYDAAVMCRGRRARRARGRGGPGARGGSGRARRAGQAQPGRTPGPSRWRSCARARPAPRRRWRRRGPRWSAPASTSSTPRSRRRSAACVSKRTVEVGPGRAARPAPHGHRPPRRHLGDRELQGRRAARHPARPAGDDQGGRLRPQATRGSVDSIAAATGARFSLLPPENATGNFVKVVQRVPVKIVFESGQDPRAPPAPRDVRRAHRPHEVSAEASPPPAHRPVVNPWIVATAVMFATFMEILDTTVVNVSLPHIAGSLSASIDESTWALHLVPGGQRDRAAPHRLARELLRPQAAAPHLGHRVHDRLLPVRPRPDPDHPRRLPHHPGPHRRRACSPSRRPSCSRPSRRATAARPWGSGASASWWPPSSAPWWADG